MNPTRKKRMMVALVPGRNIRTGKRWPMRKAMLYYGNYYDPRKAPAITKEQWEEMVTQCSMQRHPLDTELIDDKGEFAGFYNSGDNSIADKHGKKKYLPVEIIEFTL